jgi:regulator of RNase E activity RraA
MTGDCTNKPGNQPGRETGDGVTTSDSGALGIARGGYAEEDLRLLTVALAADALDALGHRSQVLTSAVAPIQPGFRLVGWARTVEVVPTDVMPIEPYAGEMAAIAALRPGDISVYHVHERVNAALFGELFSLAAAAQGAVGAILDGAVRDVRQLRELDFPVFAVGISPYDTKGRAEVIAHDVPVECGGVRVESGDLIVGDDDGVIVVPVGLVGAILAEVVEKVRGEHGAKEDLLSGLSVHEVWEKWRVF